MAKSGAERAAEFKLRHSGDCFRLDVLISTEAKNRLDELIGRYRVTKRELVERLIMQGLNPDVSGADTARELMEAYGYDRKGATKALVTQLKEIYPGFTTMSTKPEHVEAKKRYRAVVSAIHRLAKERVG